MQMRSHLPNTLADNLVAPGALTYDMTGQDFSREMPVAGSGGLLVQFFWVMVPIESADPLMNGKVERRLCLAKQPKADRSTCSVAFISEDDAARRYPNEFSMFREYQDIPTQGTPLHELPGLTQSQIGILVLHGLRSIEDLVGISSDHIAQIGIDAVSARKLAERWVDKRRGAEDMIAASKAQAAFEAREEASKRQIAALAEQLRATQAQVEALRSISGAQPATPVAFVGAGTAAMTGATMLNRDDGFDYDAVDQGDDPMMRGPATAEDLSFDPLKD